MGHAFSLQAVAESVAFPSRHLAVSSYSNSHERLIFLSTAERSIACMQYNVHTPKNLSHHVDDRKTPRPSVILYSHGNFCDIGQCDRHLTHFAQELHDDNVAFFSYDYDSYGLSQKRSLSFPLPVAGESETASAAVASITTAFEYLRGLGYRPKNIYLYGVSIGTGVSVQLAANLARVGVHVGGVLLQSPFLSTVSILSPMLAHGMDLSYACSTRNPNFFCSYKSLPLIQAPVTILHGEKDTVVPPYHARMLAQIRSDTQLELLANADHNNIDSMYHDKIIACLRSLLLKQAQT